MRANHVLHDGTAQVRFAGTDVAHQQQRTASLVVPRKLLGEVAAASQDAGHLHVVPSLVVLQRGIAKARSDAGSDQQSVQRALLLDLQGLLVLLTVDGAVRKAAKWQAGQPPARVPPPNCSTLTSV